MSQNYKRDHDGSDESKGVKKCRFQTESENVPNTEDPHFTGFPETLVRELAGRMEEFSDKSRYYSLTLTPLKILNFNAADAREGISFSRSYCSVELIRELHWFGGIFTKGIDLLKTYMLTRKVPEISKEKIVLGKLLLFLQNLMEDKEAQATLENLEIFSETELTIILANHLISKLSASKYVTIDKLCKGKGSSKCPCDTDKCEPTGHFGDTSVGNPMVWHGNLDIIVNYEVPIVVGLQPREKPDGPYRKSPVEVKLTRTCLSRNHQIMAKTIVFSFLQKLRHPEYDNFLCPCIGITSEDLIVVFYDSQNDILLESSIVPLHSQRVTSIGKVNLVALVTIWLVVNYNCFCGGLTEELKVTEKSGFFRHAGSKLNVYENSLQIGDVQNAHQTIESIAAVPLVPNPLLRDIYKDDVFTKICEGKG